MTNVKELKVKDEYPKAEDDVQLPELPQWTHVVGRPTSLAQLDPEASEELADVEATFLTLGDLAYLDSITTTEIDDNSISTPKLQAGAVEASKISVGSLSAINANLGTITAGTITGVLFRTATTGERIEIDTTNVNQIRFYDDTTLYGYIEADTVGSDGYVNLLTSDGNGIQLDTGIGASGFNAVSMFSNGGTFATSGSASNGFIGMYGDSPNEYLGIQRSSGTYRIITDLRIDDDWLPYSDSTYDLGSATYRWGNLYVDDADVLFDLDVGDDLTVGDNLTVADNCTIEDGVLEVEAGFIRLAQMSGATADARSDDLVDGNMYYRTDDDVIRVRLNGTWRTITTS